MKKIIIPVDFSKASINAVEYAIQMFGSNADISLIHVVPGELGSDEAFNRLVAENRTREIRYQLMDFIRDGLGRPFFPGNFKLIMKVGRIISSIVDHVKENEYDVMVLATRDKYNLVDKLLGTVSFGIVKQLDIPIYLIPIHSKFEGFKKVMVASDRNMKNTKTILNISKWNKSYNSFIKFLHIHTDDSPEYNEERAKILRGIFRETDPGFGFEVATINSNDVSESLLGEAYNYHADLMIVLPENQTFLQTLLYKSITKKLIQHSSIPLLFFPYGKENSKSADPKKEKQNY